MALSAGNRPACNSCERVNQWCFYDLSASEAIFTARTYCHFIVTQSDDDHDDIDVRSSFLRSALALHHAPNFNFRCAIYSAPQQS